MTPSSLDLDQLWFRGGELQAGKLLTEILRLQTPYSLLALPAAQVKSIQLSVGPHLLDNIDTSNSNRFSGFLLDRSFEFRPPAQATVILRREQVLRMMLNRPTLSPANSMETLWIHLRNGDVCSGRLLGSPFEVVGPHETLQCRLSDIDTLTFSNGHPVKVDIRMIHGESKQGAWPDRDIEIALDVGPTVKIHPSLIASVSRHVSSEGNILFLPNISTNTASPPDPSVSPAPKGMVWIPPGTFTMGSPVEEADRDLDEGPLTQVKITRGFWMGVCEVSQEEYQAMMNTNPSLFVGDSRRPVEKVRHIDAREYCSRLTSQHQADGRLPKNYAYRLPTEAEWEYACRGGSVTRFSHGNDPECRLLEDYAWFNANSNSSTHPVGTRKPNPWGLHDMQGNVLEWCLDGSTSSLPGDYVVDYQAPAEGILRSARGGSWLYDGKACRSANRDSYSVSTRSSDVGFRIVLAPVEP